jgi:hypothetical protein
MTKPAATRKPSAKTNMESNAKSAKQSKSNAPQVNNENIFTSGPADTPNARHNKGIQSLRTLIQVTNKNTAAPKPSAGMGSKHLLRHNQESGITVDDLRQSIRQSCSDLLAKLDASTAKALKMIGEVETDLESKVKTHQEEASNILGESEAAMKMAADQHAEAIAEVRDVGRSMVVAVEKALCPKRALADLNKNVREKLQAAMKKHRMA